MPKSHSTVKTPWKSKWYKATQALRPPILTSLPLFCSQKNLPRKRSKSVSSCILGLGKPNNWLVPSCAKRSFRTTKTRSTWRRVHCCCVWAGSRRFWRAQKQQLPRRKKWTSGSKCKCTREPFSKATVLNSLLFLQVHWPIWRRTGSCQGSNETRKTNSHQVRWSQVCQETGIRRVRGPRLRDGWCFEWESVQGFHVSLQLCFIWPANFNFHFMSFPIGNLTALPTPCIWLNWFATRNCPNFLNKCLIDWLVGWLVETIKIKVL